MIREQVDLKPYNTFGISVPAKFFATFQDTNQLRELIEQKKQEELLILGGGSNLLLTKAFKGLVLKNDLQGIELLSENDSEAILQVGGGVVWHDFVLHCIERELGGVENLSLIPGSVGASPMQNIGAYGVEIKDVFDHLEAFHIASGEIHRFDHQDCAFGYRESVFKRKLKSQYVITKVAYRLSKKPVLNTSYGMIEQELERMQINQPGIRDVSNAVIAIRSSKLPDPKKMGNAGSFFKNPVIPKEHFEQLVGEFPEIPSYPIDAQSVKVPAGWLIERSGWKGRNFGNFGVHEKQALVLVNYGGALGQEIYDLSEQIMSDIEQKFGIRLEREVNIL
ncbi:MAG: UDP-N-acetylmuramate dehydrogenase [Bacteroidetes bacterium]|nr:MAG: UDP-N-acetylmuramate dehydrogenase [Bacteroidota bacterium]